MPADLAQASVRECFPSSFFVRNADELPEKNAENERHDTGKAELDCQLATVAQLTIVKSRACDTLHLHAEATGT